GFHDSAPAAEAVRAGIAGRGGAGRRRQIRAGLTDRARVNRNAQDTRDRGVARQGAHDRAVSEVRLRGAGELRPRPRSARIGRRDSRRDPQEEGGTHRRRSGRRRAGAIGAEPKASFKPYYVIPNDKRKYVQALRAALKGANQVLLATDPDREGGSISWHLKEVLKPKVPVKRIVFHEITQEAINAAVRDAHDVNENLVRAQESRRILDRLYGYTLS